MKILSLATILCAALLVHVAGAQTATNLTCSQCVDSSDIANDSVGSAKIKEGSIASNDIAASGVKTANINNGAVTFNKLATGVRESVDKAVANFNLTYVYNEGDGFAQAECPVDTYAVSANCLCSENSGNNNYGFVGLCASFEVGSATGCLADGSLFDPELPDPRAAVEAVCLGATTSDGEPWVPAPAPEAVGGLEGDAALLEQRKRQYQAFEAAIGKARKEAEVRRNLLINKSR